MLATRQRVFDKPNLLAVPAARSAPPPAFELSGDWSWVWGDEFKTSNLNIHKWWTRCLYGNGTLDYLNDEWQRYRETGNHVMRGSRTTRAVGGCALTALPHDGQNWPSGLIRSKALFPIGDGNAWYMECQGKVPRGLGVWPAFWLAGSERVAGDDSSAWWPPEIDMMEIVNNGDPPDTTRHLHCGGQVLDWDRNPQGYTWTYADEHFDAQWSVWWASFDFADAPHSWSLWYQRPDFVIYCDRQPILAGTYDWVTDDGQLAPPAHIYVNLAIGGSWAGRNGIDEAAFPQAFEVDYVRVYQRLPQSTIGHDLMPR